MKKDAAGVDPGLNDGPINEEKSMKRRMAIGLAVAVGAFAVGTFGNFALRVGRAVSRDYPTDEEVCEKVLAALKGLYGIDFEALEIEDSPLFGAYDSTETWSDNGASTFTWRVAFSPLEGAHAGERYHAALTGIDWSYSRLSEAGWEWYLAEGYMSDGAREAYDDYVSELVAQGLADRAGLLDKFTFAARLREQDSDHYLAYNVDDPSSLGTCEENIELIASKYAGEMVALAYAPAFSSEGEFEEAAAQMEAVAEETGLEMLVRVAAVEGDATDAPTAEEAEAVLDGSADVAWNAESWVNQAESAE